ncbi:MAG: hypothetical protein K5924_04120 [Chloroflexi bacterium]|nr:hypothetical protein [Chloroflexota bacterium]
MTNPPPPEHPRTCRRCGADVSHGATYCPECGLVQNGPALAPVRPRRARRRAPWVVPAIIAGGLASVAGGALLSIALNGARDPVATEPSTSPSLPASAAATASVSEEPSTSPTPSPTPTAAPIANRSVAEVAVEAVTLRANANDTSAVLAELGAGRRLFVIGEPEENGELRWYRVGTLDEAGCSDDCRLIGWVSTPIADVDPTIEQADVSCPSSPMTADELAAVPPLEALHCYGRSELTVTGTVQRREPDEDPPIVFSPSWLADPNPELFLATNVGYHPLPESDLEAPEEGDRVRVRGHFEDPAATSCRATAGEDAESPTLPQPARVVLDCRATFVWMEYEILDN